MRIVLTEIYGVDLPDVIRMFQDFLLLITIWL